LITVELVILNFIKTFRLKAKVMQLDCSLVKVSFPLLSADTIARMKQDLAVNVQGDSKDMLSVNEPRAQLKQTKAELFLTLTNMK